MIVLRPRSSLTFDLRVPRSKSWINRFLILQSLCPDLQAQGWELTDADGEDVQNLARSLSALARGEREFDLGDSGTGLRFLLCRLSRAPGEYLVHGSQRLLQRPHGPLIKALALVGTQVVQVNERGLKVSVQGWPKSNQGILSLEVDAGLSSQFASGLFLSSFGYEGRLELNLMGSALSRGYLAMTEKMLSEVQAGRRKLAAEVDVSSLFALVSAGVASRLSSIIVESPAFTSQPDRVFVEILERMGCGVVARNDGQIEITQPFNGQPLRAIDCDLGDAPDLFPCLAALCALASGTSVLRGAPQLRAKESDRIKGIARLLTTLGVSVTERPDGLEIDGLEIAGLGGAAPVLADWQKRRELEFGYAFDPDHDHRLAFAAGVLAAGGAPIALSSRGVVTKSLPQYWNWLEGEAARWAVIGHRGTGKSSTVTRWAASGTAMIARDLDREIEIRTGDSPKAIFEKHGEEKFREAESETFSSLLQGEPQDPLKTEMIVMGGGFDPQAIPDSTPVLWLHRATDRDGRIFVDDNIDDHGATRPRLDPDLTPLEESLERFQVREPRFSARADRTLMLAEGHGDPAEKAWLADFVGEDSIANFGGAVTLMTERRLVSTVARLLRWGVSRLEWRDDLIQSSLAWKIAETLPLGRMIVSFRDKLIVEKTLGLVRRLVDSSQLPGRLLVDWALENGPCPPELMQLAREGKVQLVLSAHEASIDITAIDRLREKGMIPPDTISKLSIEIASFKDLAQWHEWMLADAKHRIFLPRTPRGESRARWAWYRNHIGRAVAGSLNFWREGDGSSLDQPTFSEWWRARRFADRVPFAAVLGEPVHHSRTPLEHDEFFRRKRMPVFAIAIRREELRGCLRILENLGLRFCAITSPLKQEFAEIVRAPKPAVNSAKRDGSGSWATANTDAVGFRDAWLKVIGEAKPTVAVWGGGGVNAAVESVFRDLNISPIFYSATLGSPRSRQERLPWDRSGPEVVIWASGENRGLWSRDWRPRLILDLSYTDNSAGRAIALETGARYESGLAMFRAQAAAQREFFAEPEKTVGQELSP